MAGETAKLNTTHLRRERTAARQSGAAARFEGSDITADAAVSTGEVIGSTITFAGAGGANGGGTVMAVTIKDAEGVTTDADLFLYTSAPTVIAHSASMAETAAEFKNLVGIVSIASADWETVGTGKTVVKGNLGFPFSGENLYGRLVSRAGVTYSTDTIHSVISVIQD